MDAVEAALNEASSRGARGRGEAEALLVRGKSFGVRVFKNEIDRFSYSESYGLGVRYVEGRKVGYAYTERVTPEDAARAAREAIANARWAEEEEGAGVEDFGEPESVEGLYNPELEEITVSEKIDLARALESRALAFDERVRNVPYAGYGDGSFEVRVANTLGLDRSYESNHASAYVQALAEDEKDKKTGFEVLVTRDFSEFDPKALAEKAAREAVELLGGRGVEPRRSAVVFDRRAFSSMLGAVSALFSAKLVLEGKSLLAGRVGEKIGSDCVTVVDDGLLKEGPASRPFDSEGCPTRRTELVSGGVLKGFLHNSQTAQRMAAKSTGNAARSYKGSLAVAPSNIYLEKGERKPEELLSAHERCILVVQLQGLHSGINVVSGDFSLGLNGFLYEGGKRIRPVGETTVSGNLLGMLEAVEKVGDDFKFEPPGGSTCMGSASVLVSELAVGGQA